jgi:hypothetical protein
MELVYFPVSHSGYRGCVLSVVLRDNRVREHTAVEVNERIRRQTDANIEYYGRRPELIEGRLKVLDREWDIERTLMANAATISFIGLGLGIFHKRRFLLLPVIAAGFLLHHAIHGWCPPVPVLRRMGVRTDDEITREKLALEAIRGDLGALSQSKDLPADERIETVINTLS